MVHLHNGILHSRNKEQIDSNQRGGERRIMGEKWEGLSRNMYKGHMDKAKGGRIEGGR